MSCSVLWAKTALTRRLAVQYLNTYGHLLKWKKDNENILEIGCADGNITRNILYPNVKDHVEKLVAIDALDDMISYARQHNQMKKIDYQIMDAMDQTQVRKRTGLYDHIFSFFVAHWIPDTRSLIGGFHKMLKSEGQILFTIMLNHPIHESYRRHFREKRWSEYVGTDQMMADYTSDSIKYVREIVEDVGFKVELCAREQSTEITKEFPDFIRALVLMCGNLSLIPAELHEDYIQDHIDYCNKISEYIGEPSVYNVAYDSLICIASKRI